MENGARIAYSQVLRANCVELGTKMTESQQPAAGQPDFSATIELVVRLGVLAILVAWCFKIMAPFVGPVAWGVIIAAVLLANARSGQRFAHALAEKLAGERGEELTTLARATVSSVATGIVGVALLQSVLAGIGFVAVGLPAAGLWAVMVLLFAVVQLPIPIVMIPIIVYVFSSASTPVAVVFTIWAVFVSLIDNFLKPILFGRGAQVPTLVIFIGAIGGMLTSGIIGLFTGSVILAVGYALFRAWLDPGPSCLNRSITGSMSSQREASPREGSTSLGSPAKPSGIWLNSRGGSSVSSMK